jgi:hypothetical protein
LAIYSQQIKKGLIRAGRGGVVPSHLLSPSRVRTSSADHPSDEIAQIAISFASASVLLWPVLCIDGKANICLEEFLLFVSGIIHLFLSFFLAISNSS